MNNLIFIIGVIGGNFTYAMFASHDYGAAFERTFFMIMAVLIYNVIDAFVD